MSALAVAATSAACTPCEITLGFTPTGDCDFGPLHHVELASCPDDVRPPACTPDDNDVEGQCNSDADCIANRLCVDNNASGCFCGNATCTVNNDCDGLDVCVCAGLPGDPVTRNACILGECLTDSDCCFDPEQTCGNLCVLSLGGEDCCDTGDAKGMFCTSGADECRSDTDCSPDSCIYDGEAARFVCGPRAGCTCEQ